jgi:predicted CXXCH cytochrome family protein
MKVARITLFTLLAALVAVGVSTTSYAFHSGGVAECAGCHSMHTAPVGSSFLLVGTDQSSACLTCHQNTNDTGPSSYHVSTVEAKLTTGLSPLQRTPGGDFGWLKKTYSFVQRGATVTEPGESHGHNIIAADFNYIAGATDCTVSPGGNFPSSQLGCQSCHDPHGRARRIIGNTIVKPAIGLSVLPIKGSGSYDCTVTNEPDANGAVGVYRLLASNGYVAGPYTFQGVPAAKAPATYNRTELTTQTRVAYGYATTGGQIGWGAWCGTCHNEMHTRSNIHPIDESLGTNIANIYGAYKKSGDLTGAPASSFLSLVPFAENSGDYGLVLAPHAKNNDSVLTGPASSDRVTCLSCHRAHASAFPEMLRWNMEGEFITQNGAYGTGRGRTETEWAAGYYDRPGTYWGANGYQRVLCNKCHAKD